MRGSRSSQKWIAFFRHFEANAFVRTILSKKKESESNRTSAGNCLGRALAALVV